MANLRENKRNGKIISYRFTACLERDAQGKQVRRYLTWTMLKKMKRDVGSDLEPARAVTKDAIGRLMDELSKGQEAPLISITPEQITDAIVRTADDGALAPEKLAEFRHGVLSLFEELPRSNDTSTQ